MVQTDTAAVASNERRRPRDRRQQILRQAAELFFVRGFHTVRVEDIAEEAGITARAIYRHFENKQDLLSHVVVEDQDRLLDALAAPPDAQVDAGAPALRALIERLVAASLVSLRLGPLWQREARHLSPGEFTRVREGTQRIGHAVYEAIRAADPLMDHFEAEMRAWAAVSIVTSPGHYEPTLGKRRLAALLVAAAEAVATTPSAVGQEPEPPVRDIPVRLPESRREQLIAAAAGAFRERGFGGVSLDDFGIAGPAVYRYFDGKSDLLCTLIAREQEWMSLELERALRAPVADEEVIQRLVEGYIRVATDATDLLAVAVTESLHLPDAARERDRRIRSSEIGEWTQWLRAARPELPAQTSQALVCATRTMINDLVRIPHLARNPSFRAGLNGCAGITLLHTDAR